jgi:uncharacterized protein
MPDGAHRRLTVRRDDPTFLGRGWSFPPTFTRAGAGVEMVSGAEDIRQSLRILLSTSMGERVMVHSFGCDLTPFLFEEITVTFLTNLREAVRGAIRDWEPRIKVDQIVAEADPHDPGLVLVGIDYTIRATNTRNNLVFPFYLHEATIAQPAP